MLNGYRKFNNTIFMIANLRCENTKPIKSPLSCKIATKKITVGININVNSSNICLKCKYQQRACIDT